MYGASRFVTWLCGVALAPGVGLGAGMINESARQIPVAYQVDVVVVGGSTGAVGAAVAAAEAGAKVFLAAAPPYLGEDMTATLRLWLEPGEEPASPLAKQIFSDPVKAVTISPDPNALPFSYTADQPSASVHKDTSPPSRLADGVWGSASTQSVQYDGDVSLRADLGKRQAVGQVRVVFYRRLGGKAASGFDVARIAVSASDEGNSWRPMATLGPEQFQFIEGTGDDLGVATARLDCETRYLKFDVAKAPEAGRILLGEIEIVAPSPAPTQEPSQPVFSPVRPLHVKKTLDEALLKAGVAFLYGCYATDVLRDQQGQLCGIMMANRAGRQAVLAKTIIDATDRAVVARMAGAKFRPYPAGLHTFKRVVIGGEVRTGSDLQARTITPPYRAGLGTFPIIEYTLRLSMTDASYASWSRAEQQARGLTYHPKQQFASDRLFEVPPDPMVGEASVSEPVADLGKLPLEAFRPKGVERLFVLGGCADVPRPVAERLLRPSALIDLGARIGNAAAAVAKSLPAPTGPRLEGKPVPEPAAPGDVREFLVGVRPTQEQKLATVPQEARAVPVLGSFDVVVIGGGTGGAPAGIGAARQGAKTLVVEYLSGLGGVGTLGAISNYYHGNRVGFTATIPTLPNKSGWIIEEKMEWYRSELQKAGAEIWLGTIGCGALVHEGRVIGAVVATPFGRGVVLAKTVIDATGNADVAAAAGARCIYTDESELAMQGTGLPPRRLGANYTNTDFTIVDETDLVDVWHVFVYAKQKYSEAFDQGQLVDTRERRVILGDHMLRLVDAIVGRTYPDTVIQARGGKYDTHGYTVDPYLLVIHPETTQLIVNIPYRCLVPKDLEGMLVVGLGLSAHRDVVPLTRMQPDIQNGGYAAGVAAAMAAKADTLVRHIEIRKLQEHLVQVGNLAPEVLGAEDSFPIPRDKLAAAIGRLQDDQTAVAMVFAQPDVALPLLREAYQTATGPQKAHLAFVLAAMGDPTGVETLLEEVRKADGWDEGWNYRGMGQFGHALSALDAKIVALGRAGDRRAVPVILEKLKLLTAESEFSHHRAVGLALEMLRDPAAAQPLAELLSKPGMSGYAHTDLQTAIQFEVPGGTSAVQSRRESIRELALARALYRCGDYHGLGQKILSAYAQDLRGHLARHAQAVLQAAKK